MTKEKKKNGIAGENFEFKKYFNYTTIVKNIPFILFLSTLAICYIYNGHYSDNLTRKIVKSEKNVKELQFEFKTLKSEVIFRSKESELLKVVEPIGLKELKAPPMLLGDTGTEINKN